MRVVISREADAVCFAAELEDGDRPDVLPSSIGRTEARVRIPGEVPIHPDLLAFSALLIYFPWLSSLDLNVGVSASFASAVREVTDLSLAVDAGLAARVPGPGAVPGLCYSGGADCTAALTVMPQSTRAYFLDRVPPAGESPRGLYDKSAAQHSCAELGRRGREVRTVETDLEYVRERVGFPHDLSNAVPAVLYAEHDNLDAVGWGAVLESTYRLGSKAFRDYRRSAWFASPGKLFEAVGLAVYNPVAGVSEVGTAIICHGSPYGAFAQSCIRGTIGAPCHRCWKCARKVLLDAALTGVWPATAEIEELVRNREPARYLSAEPIKHEGVVAFTVDRYPDPDGSEFVSMLRERLAGYPRDFLAATYPPALDMIPERYRQGTRQALRSFLPEMSEEQQSAVEAWDLRPLLATSERQSATEALRGWLAR